MNDIISIIFMFGVLPLIIILAIVLIQRIKHKERMSLIEKGLVTNLADKKESSFQDVLMWGMLSVGVGIGLLIGYLLLAASLLRDDAIMGILSLVFGGISLVWYFFYKKRNSNKES